MFINKKPVIPPQIISNFVEIVLNFLQFALFRFPYYLSWFEIFALCHDPWVIGNTRTNSSFGQVLPNVLEFAVFIFALFMLVCNFSALTWLMDIDK